MCEYLVKDGRMMSTSTSTVYYNNPYYATPHSRSHPSRVLHHLRISSFVFLSDIFCSLLSSLIPIPHSFNKNYFHFSSLVSAQFSSVQSSTRRLDSPFSFFVFVPFFTSLNDFTSLSSLATLYRRLTITLLRPCLVALAIVHHSSCSASAAQSLLQPSSHSVS